MGKPTPTPSHTGTVIGNAAQTVNTANDFNNPIDGKASLLVHLPSNNFVAFEKACTHEGVPVYYDQGSHMLVCPAHGSVFDPVNGGKVIQGPANRPLPVVTIRVNADGTITTG
jgi:Rieske Fe-S protein